MEPLPDGTHLIHVGPPKTGSSALQSALHRNRARLREHGVLYPGSKRRVSGAFGIRQRADDKQLDVAEIETWQWLRGLVTDSDARVVVISREGFARLWDERVHELVRDLGGPRPHVIAVARRLDRIMPSYWQQRVKRSGLTTDYGTWLRHVLEPGPGDDPVLADEWHGFWTANDTAALVRRWSAATGPGHFTLVVPPAGDRDLVPDTVADLLGVPREITHDDGGVANSSLTLPEVELVRRLNELCHDRGWPDHRRNTYVRDGVVHSLVGADTPPGQPRIPAPPDWAVERLRQVVDEQVDRLTGLVVTHGLTVAGDLDALRIPAPEDDAHRPDGLAVDPGARMPLESVLTALEAVAVASVKREEAAAVEAARAGADAADSAPQRLLKRVKRLRGDR